MNDNEIPCKLIPNMHWRISPGSRHIWYLGEYNAWGASIPLRSKKGAYYVVFDHVAFPGANGALEEQMQLEEIKWMMGE